MAFFRCKPALVGTTLWTNSSPTSSVSANTNATLSKSIANFKYISVKYRVSTSNSTTYESGLVKTSDYSASGGSSYPLSRPLWLGVKTNSSDNYSRAVNYNSNTSVTFSGCVKFGATTISNTYCIPIQIIGYN